MAAQRGKDLLIKLDMTGSGDFETIAGLRATRITFNAETVDVTNLGSQGRWRELLSGAGARSAAISGSLQPSTISIKQISQRVATRGTLSARLYRDGSWMSLLMHGGGRPPVQTGMWRPWAAGSMLFPSPASATPRSRVDPV